MRGSQKTRARTSTASSAHSLRSIGSGRRSAIQAMPGTISDSPTVSQPFSSAKVRVSASPATAPVAKIAPASDVPGRGSRFQSCSVANAQAAASSRARPAKANERSNWVTR